MQKVIVCCLLGLILCGCSSETTSEDTSESLIESYSDVQPQEAYDWFSEAKYPVPMGIVVDGVKRDLVNINIPESLRLYDVRVASLEGGASFIWDNLAPTSKEVVEDEMLKNRIDPLCQVSVNAPSVDTTTMYFVTHDGTKYNVSDTARDYADMGSEFEWEGHKCFLLGTDTEADAAKYGDLTVFYEIEPDGAYISLGYVGPLTDTKTDMEIAENLCSLVEII